MLLTAKGIDYAQLATLKGAVKLEKLGMTRRGRSAKAIACELIGMPKRSTHDQVITALEKEMHKLQHEVNV